MYIYRSFFVLCLLALLFCLHGRTINAPCGGDTPLTDPDGNDLYCGRGGERCPEGSYCDIERGDRYAKCCPKIEPEPLPCQGTKPLTNPYSGEDLYCGRGGQPCPPEAYCDIHKSDKYAKCCEKDKPGNCPTINCFRSNCKTDSDCEGKSKCCFGCCAEPIFNDELASQK